MKRAIQSELLKMRHSSASKMAWYFPIVGILAGYLISQFGLYAQQFTYNIWYGTFFPCLIPLLCGLHMRTEKRLQFQTMLISPVSASRQWIAKSIAVTVHLAKSMAIFGAVLLAVSSVLIAPISWENGVAALIALLLVSIWQVPFYLCLTVRIGMILSMVFGILCTFISFIPVEKELFFLFPFSIGARLMCPLLGIRPNGLLLEPGDPLLDSSVLMPGIVAAIILLAAVLKLCILLWKRKEA